MSRIGKKPILIPQGVQVKIEGEKITIKGPKGEISREIRPEIKVEEKEGKILISPKVEMKKINAFWGLTRALIANMVKGVVQGYEKQLEIEGLGYKAAVEGEDLVLNVGFTNPVRMKSPTGIKISVEKNIIKITGIDKETVGQFASRIKKVRAAEPYKGKGIKYVGEVIRRKTGKKAATATTATT